MGDAQPAGPNLAPLQHEPRLAIEGQALIPLAAGMAFRPADADEMVLALNERE